MTTAPGALAAHGFLGVSWWDWLAGPSVAMIVIITLAIWTTSGTFMLIFLPAIYAIPADLDAAATVDGASAWQRFRKVTLPMLRPTLFLVLTLGLIGLVVNGLLLWLTSWVAGQLTLPFHITGFWAAFWGAIIVGVVGWLLGVLILEPSEHQ